MPFVSEIPALVRRAQRAAFDQVFPPQCALCRAFGSMLCTFCEAALPLAEHPRCDRCWNDIASGSLCEHCLSTEPPLMWIRSPFAHDHKARTLVHLFKYGGLSSVAEPAARSMCAFVEPGELDLIVPVPLHPSRQRSRGYNQAALLAREISRRTHVPLDERAARRTRRTRPLAESMSRAERQAIVRGAFSATGSRVEGARILLIDDVATTGATLSACAEALHAAGAASVAGLTLTRA